MQFLRTRKARRAEDTPGIVAKAYDLVGNRQKNPTGSKPNRGAMG